MSLSEVAGSTKIAESVLQALEHGQVERLPGRVFVVNYIRAYARIIGMEPEEAVLRYEEIDATLKSAPPVGVVEQVRRARARWTIITAVVGAALALALAILFGRG
jgi:cytoskeletal protein RodZ